MLIRIKDKINGTGSGNIVKYKQSLQNGTTVKTYDIKNDFPNYANLTANNFFVVTIETLNKQNISHENSDPLRGNFGGWRAPEVITYNSTTGTLTIKGPCLHAGTSLTAYGGYKDYALKYDLYVWY